MDKKKLVKSVLPEDLKGFEEFIEGEPKDANFLPRGVGGGTKRETNFEHFTFLTNDAERLSRLKRLLSEKLPFAGKHQQGAMILNAQKNDLKVMRRKIFEEANRPGSGYRSSLSEIFDSFFGPTKG